MFNFVSVNEVYIDNVINKLKNTSSYGYDNISNKHIKYARKILTKPLTLLINQCLQTGIYPSQLKLLRVKPLHKAGDKTQFGNYRPVVAMSSSQCINRGRACIVVNRDNHSEYYMCVHVVWQVTVLRSFQDFCSIHLTMAKILWTY